MTGSSATEAVDQIGIDVAPESQGALLPAEPASMTDYTRVRGTCGEGQVLRMFSAVCGER
jgi:hypothetical protein